MKRTRTYNLNLILIIIFIITGGTFYFGFAHYLFSIPFPFFKITENLGIILYLLFVSFIISKKKINYRKGILKYYFYFLLLLLLIALKNIVLLEISIIEIVQRIKGIYILFLIFPIITLINSRLQLVVLIKALYVISLISSIVYLFQYSTGVELGASSGGFYKGIYRINHPGIVLSSFVFFITMAHFLVFGLRKKYFIYYVVALFSLIIMVLSLSRGYILAGTLTFVLILFRSFSAGFSKAFIRGVIFVSFLGGSLFFYSLQNPLIINLFIERMEEGVSDISKNTGTFDTRYDMVMSKMSYIAEHNPIFGIGFDYYTAKNEEEALTMEFYNNPISIVGDSTYQNITIISGFFGLILWLFNLFYLNRKGQKIFKKSNDKFVKFVALFGSVFPLFIFIHGFSSNYYSNSGFIVLSLNIGFLYIASNIDKMNKSKII